MKNLVVGTEISVKEPMFEGNFRNATYVGDREWRGVVVKEMYGASNKHWFTMKITELGENCDDLEVGKTVRRQGKNIYSNCDILSQPVDEVEKTRLKTERKMGGIA